MNLRRCHLQLYTLKKLIFVNTNQPNNLKVGYKFFFNLIKLIKINADLGKELEKFEEAFEMDEIVKIYNFE